MSELRGKELYIEVFNTILANPKDWKQSTWHCGTAHCFGGWCQVKGGLPAKDEGCANQARELLGISEDDADWLFAGHRTITDLHSFGLDFINDRDGYNLDGYNRAGYNLDGYNLDGYNRAGYNLDGYNLDGYNRAGYDRDGYDRDGYNRAGYNRDGYDRDGYDRAGYNLDGVRLGFLAMPKASE